MIILISNQFRVIITLFILVLLFASLHIKYNRKDEMTIVERLGKFNRLIETPSIFFIIPFIDRVLERISEGEIVDARRFTYLKNDAEIKENITIRYKVFDPQLYAYASIDAIGSIVDLIKTAKENNFVEQDINDQVKSYGRDLGITVINYHFD